MLKLRIIPCLDIKDGLVVKGKGFVDLDNVGSPINLSQKYNDAGADELCFLDINASFEGRKTTLNLVQQVAKTCFIPLTVGGGVNDLTDIENLLKSGADKVSINSSAVKNPSFIGQAAHKFGSQCIVVAIDAKLSNGQYKVFIKGGRQETDIILKDWVETAQSLGAGEILLTSIDTDGKKNGYDLNMLKIARNACNLPIIASGGVGSLKHFVDGAKAGASGLLAASIFHYNQFSIEQVKAFLKQEGFLVR